MTASVEEYVEKIKNTGDFFLKAKLLKFLNKDKQIRIKDLAKETGLKPSYLCHILRLNRLPELVVDGYYAKMISLSHLFIISRLKNNKDIIFVYENILKNNLSVIQVENLVRDMLYGYKSEGNYLQQDDYQKHVDLIKKIQPDFKLKVIQSRIKSRIIVEIQGSLAKTSPLIKNWLKKMSEDL